MLLELATGAGKSLIVAEIAKFFEKISDKKVLCLAPSQELVTQNREKYLSYGNPASVYSASAGGKCLKHKVVFGSPLTVKNDLHKFVNFGAVIVDEAHGVTPTLIEIIESMKDDNPNLRVLGLTATPYRMGQGYIYEIDENDKPVAVEATKDPYFKKLLYRVTADFLINHNPPYLTEPVTDVCDGYDTGNLVLSNNNKFTPDSVEKAFEGKGRLTSDIVADVVEKSINRKGVMLFASTIQHANEIMESLPKSSSSIVTGKTKPKERKSIVSRFKAKKIKYIVSVGALTTGFDAPHVDVVAILRATESPGLLQQIIGRGLRLDDGKVNCLALDYAGNIERHKLENGLFDPEIKSVYGGGELPLVQARCDVCNTVNEFSARKNPEEFDIDEYGYFVDLAGNRIVVDDQPLPGHYGRRCLGQTLVKGQYERCNGRWSFKSCPECDHENDIAARYCKNCKGELVDPNEKLQIDFKKLKANPRAKSTDKVTGWNCQKWVSRAGNESLRIDWTTEYRTFPAWYSPIGNTAMQRHLWSNLSQTVFGEGKVAPSIDMFIDTLKKQKGKMPKTITAKKDGDFFTIYAHGEPEDEIQSIRQN